MLESNLAGRLDRDRIALRPEAIKQGIVIRDHLLGCQDLVALRSVGIANQRHIIATGGCPTHRGPNAVFSMHSYHDQMVDPTLLQLVLQSGLVKRVAGTFVCWT